MDNKRPFRKRLASLVQGSFILSALDRLSRAVSEAAQTGLVGSFFTSYKTESKAGSQSMTAFLHEKLNIKGRFLLPLKRAFARSVRGSLLIAALTRFFRGMLRCSLKFYGIFTFFFSLYTVIVALLKHFALAEGALFSPDLFLGVILFFAAIPCMAVKRPIGDVIGESRILSFLLFGFLGIRRASFLPDGDAVGKSNIAIITGMMAGALTFFVSPFLMLFAFFGLLFLYLILTVPESGVVLIFLTLPFLPTLPLGAFTVYVFFCYLIKLFRSKRTFKLEPLDLLILLFALLTFFGGFVSVSTASRLPSLMFLCFLGGYFLTVNLIRSPEWIGRVVGALIASAALVALYGLYQKVTGNISTTWQDSEMFSYIDGRITSTLENPNVLAEYLIMTLPFAFAFFLTAKKGVSRILALALCGLSGAALIFTWSRGAWLGLMIGGTIFLLLYSRHTISALLFCCLGIPFLPFVIPESILLRLTSIGNLADSSTSYRMSIWKAAVRMFSDHLFSGIGIGEGAFATVYPEYALAGIESAPHSHNLFLQIGIELGIVGLGVFLLILILFARSALTLSAETVGLRAPFGVRSIKKRANVYSLAGFCGILAVLAQGMTDYVWYNYRVFFLFWLVIGIVSSMHKVFRREGDDDALLPAAER